MEPNLSLSYNSQNNDNNGNLISDGTWTHGWDYDDRLIDSANGSSAINYAYGQDGNRLTYSDGTATTTYVNKYYNISSAGTVVKNIFLENQLIAAIEANGTSANAYYVHSDHLGGSNAITDENGDMVQLLDYYPFGEIRLNEKTGKFDENRKYTGHIFDDKTELNYMGARYHDGDAGKFMSQDPVAKDNSEAFLSDPQQLNTYAYSRNNPLRFIDPTGKSSVSAWLANPIKTALQVIFWNIGSKVVKNTTVAGGTRPASSALMQYSLSVNPKDITVMTENQNKYGNMIDAIKGSSEYNKYVNEYIGSAENIGMSNFISDPANKLVFGPKSSDLFSALHGTASTEIKGVKGENGNWNLSVNITDTYDYKLQPGEEQYKSNYLFNSLNNAAYFSQKAGAISNYGVTIKFEDQRKGGGNK